MHSAAWSLCSGNLIGHICPRPTVNARASSGKLPQLHVYALQGVARAVTRRHVLRVACTALMTIALRGKPSLSCGRPAARSPPCTVARHTEYCYGPLVLCAAAQAVEHGIDEGFDLARVQHRLHQRRCAGLPGVDIATSGAAMHVALRPACCALQTTRWTLRALITGAARSAERCMTQGTMHDAATHVLGRGSPHPTESRVEGPRGPTVRPLTHRIGLRTV
jgi:hypothetical protein